jgi:putative zinc finger/helix-turn-helix YgiT family protein
MPYVANLKHDGRVYHIEIPELKVPKCRACGEITFSNDTDDQITAALRSHLKLLTPQQIKAGRKRLGLKAKELAEQLGTAAATVSRWEQGRLIQSRAMDNLLRLFFESEEVRTLLRQRFAPAPVNRLQGQFRKLPDADQQRRRAVLFEMTAPKEN